MVLRFAKGAWAGVNGSDIGACLSSKVCGFSMKNIQGDDCSWLD